MSNYRYPGTQPFSTDEEHIFFGRKTDIEALHRQVRLEPLVILYSKSGLGKSSLMNAGLVPAVVRENKYLPIKIRFNAYNPNSEAQITPLESTQQAIATGSKDDSSVTYFEKLLPYEQSLWYQLKQIQAHSKGQLRLLLLFDQFEELFTYPDATIQTFKEQLAELLYTQIPQRFRTMVEQEVEQSTHLTSEELALLHQSFDVRMVVAIRSDRISLLDRLADRLPTIKRSWYELDALQVEQAEDAILNPAYMQGTFASPIFDYEDEALQKMLNFLTQNQRQKIESFQLQILCQAIERKLIRQGLNMVTAAELGNIEEVYENYYTDQIKSISNEEDQLAARRFIEEGLIFDEEERRLSLYEGQVGSQFNISSDLLRQLEDTHLIRREASMKGGYTYELSHDTLVAPVLRAKALRLTAEHKIAEENERKQREKELKAAKDKAAAEKLLRRKAQFSEQRARQRTNLILVISALTLLIGGYAGWESLRAKGLQAEIEEYGILAKQTRAELLSAKNNIIKLTLDNAEEQIADLKYEEALAGIQTIDALFDSSTTIAKAYLELAFWYNESRQFDRAKNILDSAALAGNWTKTSADLKSMPKAISTPEVLRSTIQAIAPNVYQNLWERYYPIMIPVKGGTFMMGCDSTIDKNCRADETLHEATISDFAIAKYETTWWQYYLFCVATKRKYEIPAWGKQGDNPVVKVNWSDAVSYANWVTNQKELSPAIKVNGNNYQLEIEANGFRLPTEAEWEYAAKGGVAKQRFIYSGSNDLKQLGWHSDNAGGRTHPVGQLEANQLELHDMSGNVYEWCWDRYTTYPVELIVDYTESKIVVYTGSEYDEKRVLRGGAWLNSGGNSRSSFRYFDLPRVRYNYNGFRLARTVGQKTED